MKSKHSLIFTLYVNYQIDGIKLQLRKYILFDSAHYEPIAESGITGAEYDGVSHRYFSCADSVALISDDENFSENSTHYEAVDIVE